MSRSTLRFVPTLRADESPSREAVVALAAQYERCGCRRVTGLLPQAGWAVSRSRVERLWKQEGLKAPAKQPKRGRLWIAVGSYLRLRLAYRLHVWSWDFILDRTEDGPPLKLLVVLDEWSRECRALLVARRVCASAVLDGFADLMQERGVPAYLRPDDGPEMVAATLRGWLGRVRAQTVYITLGSPCWNGYCESFSAKLRYEFQNRELFTTLYEAQVLAEYWRMHFNRVRPHSALGHGPPVPETVMPTRQPPSRIRPRPAA